jgi:3-oxoacyl-(acyl-carrier-protein) synthase
MSDGSIAIVGASCRFPGAGNLEQFWRLLVSAGDAVSEIDAGRWSTRFYFHPDRGEPGKSYTWSAGLITDVDRFEPAFFGISPREAVQMDPQQRLLLELVWHALEDAGIPPSRLCGGSVGVYVGASTRDYTDLRLGDPAGGDAYFMIGNTLSILANRISYTFDLRGPSLTIDTACSSSLVAFHQACEALRNQRIESAVVGGINLLLAPYPFLGFCRASMLSRRGRCYAFDERADGYVRGEGGGVVILKPLAAALTDGDPIRAVVRGSGVNSDGRVVAAERGGASFAAALGLRHRRDRRGLPCVLRNARNRHAGRGSDRSHRRRTLDRLAAITTAADRIGQDQYRPSRTGFRHGGGHQGGACPRAANPAADLALRAPEPADSLRGSEPSARPQRRAAADGRRRTLRRRQRIRVRRHQCPCHSRGGAAANGTTAGGTGGPPARDLGAQRGRAARVGP